MSLEFKGTKGEWKSVFVPATEYIPKRYEVCHGIFGECVAEFIENEHDAKLIAAAPDLLEALQLLKDGFEDLLINSKNPNRAEDFTSYTKAKQAIEKALK